MSHAATAAWQWSRELRHRDTCTAQAAAPPIQPCLLWDQRSEPPCLKHGLRRLSKGFEVGEVFRPARSALVADEFASANERDIERAYAVRDPRRPGLVEQHAGDLRHEVDPARGEPDLYCHSGGLEVTPRDSQRRHRGPKAQEGGPDTLDVRRGAVDPDIEVPGGARNPVDSQSVRADNEKACAGFEEALQEVKEILVHGFAAGVVVARGTQRTGASWRA